MARLTKPLTSIEIKQAKPKAKEYSLMDGQGLKLRVKPTGGKLWLFNYYKPYTQKRTNISFGSYPDVTLIEARQKRSDARSLLSKYIDPKEHWAEQTKINAQAHSNTFEEIASQWIEIKKSKVTPNYAEEIWRSLVLHLFPSIGSAPIHKLTAPLVIDVIKPIAARGSLETVKRLCQRINEVMMFAVNSGVTTANPLAGIGKAFPAPQKHNMPTLKPDQLPELMSTIANASIKLVTRYLIEWQLHTMARPSEAAGARWEEIDFDNKIWHIPAERMKKRKAHSTPISPHVMALLDSIRPISGRREYIFPSDRDPKRHINEQSANTALKRMGYKGQLVAHGLRALASTTLNEQGFDPDVIEAALAHVDSNEVRRAYNRADYLEKRRDMMTWWSEHINDAATGNLSLASARK